MSSNFEACHWGSELFVAFVDFVAAHAWDMLLALKKSIYKKVTRLAYELIILRVHAHTIDLLTDVFLGLVVRDCVLYGIPV